MTGYAQQSWVNAPDTSSPINQTRLNFMESGIFNAQCLAIRDLAVNGQLELADANGMVLFNSGTKRTFTFRAHSLVPIPRGYLVTIGNEGAGDIDIVDNTTGTPVVIRTLRQGEYGRWLKTNTASDNWLIHI